MRRYLLVCATIGFVFAGTMLLADSPPLTEEQIEAQLKEAQKRVETARAEERALQKRLEDAKAQPRGQIKAEITGVLGWRETGGYYVRVRPKDEPKREIRISLTLTEDKILLRRLEELKGQEVVAKGELLQNADLGLYMGPFEIEAVKHK
jgi:hypothetical protein